MTEARSQTTSMGELLGAFAYASDLAFGLHLEDSLRSCYLAMRVAQHMGLSEQECATVYYTSLLKDAGCTSWNSELAKVWQTDEIAARRELIVFSDWTSYGGLEAWVQQYVAPDLPTQVRQARLLEVMAEMPQLLAEAITNTTAVAERISDRLGMPPSVRKGLRHVFEQWSGGGAPDALAGEAIPVASRIALASLIVVPVHRMHGRDSALESAQRSHGVVFDPDVVKAMEELWRSEEFWAGVEGPQIRERVSGMEPKSHLSEVGEEKIDDIALAFADFIDLKSPHAASHSRRVARVSEQVARVMGCAEEATALIRRAALVHDLGLVAVPSFFVEKPEEQLSDAEWEQYRLHPYHGERILRRVPVLAPLAEMVGNHHERLDGTGYFRGLHGAHISLGARIIAIADQLDELTHDAPGRPAIDVEQALARLDSDAGFDRNVTQAVLKAIGSEPSAPAPPLPAGLTQREVTVLRLAARGMTRASIGAELGITEHTVRHHLEHIYAKTGTSTRVAAALFAIENGLFV